MQKGRDTNPLLVRGGLVFPLETRFFFVIVRELQAPLEKFLEIDRFLHCLFGGRGLSSLQEIPLPHFDWRHANRRRDAIHVPLHSKQTLRRSESTKRAMRR